MLTPHEEVIWKTLKNKTLWALQRQERQSTDIDKQAEEMFVLLVKELAENENVTEQLKAENQMLWMHQMNNIHNRVMEIINTDLIYV